MRNRGLSSLARAFTLTELMVVIGVIAVLIGLLLPAIRRGREMAQSVGCLANLRTIGQGMIMYAAQNRDAIAGSPHTSGLSLWQDAPDVPLRPGVTVRHIPGDAIALFDFMGPIARALNIEVPESEDGVVRLRAYRELKGFMCPSNSGINATKFYGSVEMEDGPMLSYGTGLAFMLMPTFVDGYQGRTTAMSPTKYWAVEPSYLPRVSKVGNAAEKIYCADSGRWSRYNSPPTFSMKVNGDHNDTMFGDFGPFWIISKSYDRSMVNQMNSATIDGRVFSYRHGRRTPGGAAGAYRMNAVFFDGHAEQMDDMASANPDLWLPRGTVISHPTDDDGGMYPDVRARYLPGVDKSHPYTVR